MSLYDTFHKSVIALYFIELVFVQVSKFYKMATKNIFVLEVSKKQLVVKNISVSEMSQARKSMRYDKNRIMQTECFMCNYSFLEIFMFTRFLLEI